MVESDTMSTHYPVPFCLLRKDSSKPRDVEGMGKDFGKSKRESLPIPGSEGKPAHVPTVTLTPRGLMKGKHCRVGLISISRKGRRIKKPETKTNLKQKVDQTISTSAMTESR